MTKFVLNVCGGKESAYPTSPDYFVIDIDRPLAKKIIEINNKLIALKKSSGLTINSIVVADLGGDFYEDGSIDDAGNVLRAENPLDDLYTVECHIEAKHIWFDAGMDSVSDTPLRFEASPIKISDLKKIVALSKSRKITPRKK